MAEDKLSQTMSVGFDGAFGIVNLETDRPIGMMADISLESIKVTTWKPLQEGSVLCLRLRLPEAVGGSPFIIFNAMCQSCSQGSDERSFLATLSFQSITPSNQKRINELLAMLGRTPSAGDSGPQQQA